MEKQLFNDTDQDKRDAEEKEAYLAFLASARGLALEVTHLWDAPEVVTRYLEKGKETVKDITLEDAREAAWAAWLVS